MSDQCQYAPKVIGRCGDCLATLESNNRMLFTQTYNACANKDYAGAARAIVNGISSPSKKSGRKRKTNKKKTIQPSVGDSFVTEQFITTGTDKQTLGTDGGDYYTAFRVILRTLNGS